jgi:hypothetical protein
MGFDSQDGRGERPILTERRSYMKPMLTGRGDRIVFSTNPMAGREPQVFMLHWDGAGLTRPSSTGFALAVWENPVDDSDWVYVGQDNAEYSFRRVVRCPLDNPAAVELVWDKTPGVVRHLPGIDRWPVRRGPVPLAGSRHRRAAQRRAAHGRGRLLDGDADRARPTHAWYFDGAHRNLTLVDAHTDKRWTVPINTAPGFDNPEVYHPRWTNHPRFLAMSGPYDQGGANQVRSGGTQAEIWLGRFSEDFSSVEAWFRVTTTTAATRIPTSGSIEPQPARGASDRPGRAGGGSGRRRSRGRRRATPGGCVSCGAARPCGPHPDAPVDPARTATHSW